MVKVYQDWDDTTHEVLEVVRHWNGWAVPRVTVDQATAMGVFDQNMSSFLVRDGDAFILRQNPDWGSDAPDEAVTPNPDGTLTLDFGWTYSD